MNRPTLRSCIAILGFWGVSLCGTAFGAGVSLTNVPTGVLTGLNQFTVSVVAQIDSGNLAGAYLEMTASPSGAVRVVSFQPGSAVASIFKTATGTNRILWANAAGRSGLTHEIGQVTYEVLSPGTASSATLSTDILELRWEGGPPDDPFPLIIQATSEPATISILVPTPTPVPTRISIGGTPTPDPGTNPGSNVVPSLVSGGCGTLSGPQTSESATGTVFLVVSLFALLYLRKKRIILGLAFLVLVSGTAQARTFKVHNATELSNLCQTRFSSGDEIVVDAGIHELLGSTVEITPSTCGSGALGIPIVLRGDGASPGETILDGGGKAVLGLGEGLSYWIIENMEFRNGGPWNRSGGLPTTAPHMIAGEAVSYGIVVRNNRFSGSLAGTGPGSPVNKSVVYLKGITTISSFDEGFAVENNFFTDVDFTNATANGYAYVNVFNGAYSVLRGNDIRHTTRSTSPYHLIEIDGGGHSLVERNFVAGALRGLGESSAVVIRRQSAASVVRNNIIYVDAGAVSGIPANDVPVAAIFIGEGSLVKNLIHSNSVKMVKQGTEPKEIVAHVYTLTSGDGAYVTNNVFEGGDFAVSSAYSWVPTGNAAVCTSPNGRITLASNFIYGLTDHPPLVKETVGAEDRYRCSLTWLTPVSDGQTAYSGGDPSAAGSYTLRSSSAAETGGAISLSRCSTLNGTAATCAQRMGAWDDQNPYGSTTMFSFCGVLSQNNRPDFDLDRRLELEDVLRLSSVNPTLAGQLATYLTTFRRTDLSCF